MWTAIRPVVRRVSGLDVLSLAMAEEHLRVASGIDTAFITECVRRAVDFVEGPDGVGVALTVADWVLSLDCLPRRVALPLGPVVAIKSVMWRGGDDEVATLDPAAYRLDAGSDPAMMLARPGAAWPSPVRERGSVELTFSAGYATSSEIPGPLVQAVALLVGDFYAHREATLAGARVAEIPIGVERLLAPYRRGQIA